MPTVSRTVCFWHLKALGYCNRQMRLWCKKTGYSWRRLCAEGIDADYLLSIDDTSYAHKAIDFAASTGWSTQAVPVDGKIDREDC